MKTAIYSIVFLFVISIASSAHATVGGPTYIYNFTYNHADESVYYIETNQGGRGCPPMLNKISLETKTVSPFYTCEDGETVMYKLSNGDYQKGLQQVQNDIADITKNFKPLIPITLAKSKIEIDIRFVEKKYYTQDATDDFSHRVFMADVYQNGAKVDEFEITGCSMEQPFVFHGYAIPGFDKKIVILSSAKNDCVEGGYTRDRLHVVGNLSNIDKTPANFFKWSDEIPLNEASLVVYEKDTIVATTSTTTIDVNDIEENQQNKNSSNNIRITLIAIIILAVGFAIGRLKKKA